MSKRYSIQVRVVEIDDEGIVVDAWSGVEMDIASTDPNAFAAASFSVACERHVEQLILRGDLDQMTLSKARPASSLPKLPFVPPLES